ncbi:MAG: hypothetical protein WA020_01505 [Candidatus Acidiferrales bacterium]
MSAGNTSLWALETASRARAAFRRLVAPLLLLCGILMIAGCPQYFSQQEVISKSVADKIPYADSVATLDDGTKLHITQAAASNDYQFTGDGHPGDVGCSDKDTGTLRFLHLRDDLFAMQEKCDDSKVWTISFYRIHEHDFQEMSLASNDDEFGLAARNNVKLATNDDADLNVSGSSRDVLAFLRAHKDFTFQATETKKDDN